MVKVSVLTGPERRRRWSDAQKLELLAQAFGPDGSPAETARRADVCTSLLYRWRRASRAVAEPMGFSPAVLIEGPGAAAGRTDGPALLVELPSGARVSVTVGAPTALVTAVLRALR
ncbi:MAG: transposase [Nevskia sp.]|nr:transposase [Nevskia sp.]